MLPSLKTADFLKNDLFEAKLVEMSKMYPVILLMHMRSNCSCRKKFVRLFLHSSCSLISVTECTATKHV